jgi:hypothetical protein
MEDLILSSYDDLREGDMFVVGNECWEVVNDAEDGEEPILGVWTNACKCFSPSLANELITACVPVRRATATS